jgi:hypothetical protein
MMNGKLPILRSCTLPSKGLTILRGQGKILCIYTEDEPLKSLPSPGLLIAKNVDDPDKDTLMVQSITAR